jgi:hypothetical protein
VDKGQHVIDIYYPETGELIRDTEFDDPRYAGAVISNIAETGDFLIAGSTWLGNENGYRVEDHVIKRNIRDNNIIDTILAIDTNIDSTSLDKYEISISPGGKYFSALLEEGEFLKELRTVWDMQGNRVYRDPSLMQSNLWVYLEDEKVFELARLNNSGPTSLRKTNFIEARHDIIIDSMPGGVYLFSENFIVIFTRDKGLYTYSAYSTVSSVEYEDKIDIMAYYREGYLIFNGDADISDKEIQIIDIRGKLIYVGYMVGNKLKIDLSSGVYVVSVDNSGKTYKINVGG